MAILAIGEFQGADLSLAAVLEDLRASHSAEQLAVAGPVSRVLTRAFPTLKIVDQPNGSLFERVIVCGPFGSARTWREALKKAYGFPGSTIEFHNLSLPFHSDLMDLPLNLSELQRIAAISVRDHRTAELVLRWPIENMPRMIAYPERMIQADFSLAGKLSDDEFIGISFRNTGAMMKAIDHGENVLASTLRPFEGTPILPLPANLSPGSPSDTAGIRAVVERFLPDAKIVMPELLDDGFIDRELTAPRLKALVSICRVIVTQRELPVVFAAAYKKRVIAIAAPEETGALRALSTLANDLLPTSQTVRLSS